MKVRGYITAIVLALMMVNAVAADNKRYEVKSGIIEYTINGGGSMMGVKTQTSGRAKTVFKDWGTTELQFNTSETVTMGQKEHRRELTKLEQGNVFVVDFNQKVIFKYTPSMLANSNYMDLSQSSKEMMTSMGGQKIKDEEFMGYPCEVWELMQVRLWIHKGIVLKSDSNIMGIKHTMVATNIDLGASVSESDLKLPDYPIKEADLQKMMEEGEDEDSPELTQEQMQQMQEMIKDEQENASEPTEEELEQIEEMMRNLRNNM